MAQGKGKLKSNSGVNRKEKRHQKLTLKKGARYIAPKKTKALEAVRLKKTLEKAIKTNIEQEITMKAKSVESKHFNIIKTPQDEVKMETSAGGSKLKKK
ncbi:hypothetical protein CHS0354_007627 [Potamilus streckersoni]|uniref:Leydig cell tumor 10 kDa protein homolog n=1 Tax=Potamilus streckersoni TaxID=2493646 RepID=A0AAE0T486_9BIVA|nr:hypothetical protein CHS0354_007627 [Potamilus streckersoni]